MLGWLLHAPRGPFYSPKAARSRWKPTRKAKVSFCRVVHRTVPVACPVWTSFLIWRRRPLHLSVGWRTGQSGAPFRPLVRATCRPPISLPTVAQSTVGSPDSPVHHRTVRWILAVRRWTFPESDDFATDDSPDSPINYNRTPLSSPESDRFTLDSSGAPDTVRCT
jgi:hypothetical protein